MWQLSLPWKESDGYHRRFPYAFLTRRESDDGAPRVPGEAEDTLPGAFGPIAVRDMVAYRVIEPAANGAAVQGRDHHPDRDDPPGPLRRPRWPPGARGDRRRVDAVAFSSSPSSDARRRRGRVFRSRPDSRTTAFGTQPRRPAVGRDDHPRRLDRTCHRPHEAARPLPAGSSDEAGKAVAGASASVMYEPENPPPIPLPRARVETDSEGRFRVEGSFPGTRRRSSFIATERDRRKSEHYRPETLRKLVLDDTRPAPRAAP